MRSRDFARGATRRRVVQRRRGGAEKSARDAQALSDPYAVGNTERRRHHLLFSPRLRASSEPTFLASSRLRVTQPPRQALAEAAARFGFSATPRLDAELLLAHALGLTRERLLLTLADHPVPPTFAAFVERRANHEPVAYITGERAFWTIDLHVGPGVLIPRADSETLIEAAVDHFAGTPGPRTILDLGTGPGTLLLAALAQWPEAHGLGIDAFERALDYAEINAQDLDFAERVRLERGDWFAGRQGEFDLILCNPPYISTGAALPPEVSDYEPAAALFAGTDGLDAYRVLAPPDRPRDRARWRRLHRDRPRSRRNRRGAVRRAGTRSRAPPRSRRSRSLPRRHTLKANRSVTIFRFALLSPHDKDRGAGALDIGKRLLTAGMTLASLVIDR